MIEKKELYNLYTNNKKSARDIAKILKCSENKVNYWLKKHSIEKRSISEAVYSFNNPLGDPFKFKQPTEVNDCILYGIGLGLYWGEGTKRSKGSVRLGNTDPEMIRVFILFLEKFFSVRRSDMKFGIQVFSDMSAEKCEQYWIEKLKIVEDQLYKTIITPSRGRGTYRRKMVYGVMTVYYNNTKFQKMICEKVDKCKML